MLLSNLSGAHPETGKKKRDERELGLPEYLASYAAVPSEKNMAFLQHFSRYEFFARKLASTPNVPAEKVNLSETSLKGLKILDAGCGEGFGSSFLAGLGAQVTGLDFNEDIVNHAQKKYASKDLTFVAGDVCHMSFPDACFDTVGAMDLIEHLESPENFIAEARRVLKKNGLLMFSTPNHLKHLIETGEIYPFHEREFLYSELIDFAGKLFKRYELYGQCPDWIKHVCDSLRNRDFTKAPASTIARFKLLGLARKAIPKSVKTWLIEKRQRDESRDIKYEKLKDSAIYKSITFVQERYETCSDFVLIVTRENITGV
jgi:2-polyprenyl-3-methyl-5-hydroxy-6-metoxy-1,4-benzoquinol methylase